MEDSGAPPLPVTASTIEEGQTTVETAAPQAALEPSAGAGSGGADVVMVPSDEDSALPPPAGDRDVMMSTAPEPSLIASAASVEDVMDLAACRYVDFPGIGTIDLNTPELPGNDRELLEAAMDQMFSKPTILETITLVASALHQYEGAVLTVYFGAPSMFITLWFGCDYGTNPPLGTLII
jgi:hypothetical protein